MTWYLWLLLLTLLFTQALWVYLDAQKNGHNKWFWGLFCLLNVPSNGIVYLVITKWLPNFYRKRGIKEGAK